MKMNYLLPVIALAVTVTCSSCAKMDSTSTSKDIVAVASGAGNLSTLVTAIKAAGLVETLQGPGPFTVFAPTDAAFAKLPQGTLDDLLKPENKAKLAGILTYHVVAGKVMAADVKTMMAKTVNGQELDIKAADGVVTVNDAKVTKTDIVAKNGVIHLIDSVLMPK
jgi:transforming growth factor-beta-induced protein